MLYTEIEKVADGTIDNEEVCVSLPFRQKWNMIENLKLSAEDEGDEAIFYEEASKTANEEGFKDIANLFNMIKQVELKHKKIFMYLYKKLKEGELYKSDTTKRWTCPACGYEATGEEAFDECPLCKAKLETVRINFPKELML
jgi:rubrerythrin